MSARPTFDAYAVDYQHKFNDNFLGKYQRARLHAEISPYLNPGLKVLDVGCGPGSDFYFYHSRGVTVEALDISPAMVDLARQKAQALGLDATVHCQDFQTFPSSDSYSFIMLNFGVINAITDLETALEKLNKLLRADGTLVIVAMPPFHLFSQLGLLRQGRFREAFRRLIRREAVLPDGFRFHYYRQKDFRKFLRLKKRIHLCPLLPNPDQYHQDRFSGKLTERLLKLDRFLATRLPDCCGGDHVCYIYVNDHNSPRG